jgi:predicted lysophospholipase L1 biosynthesis ABC-type transport system permease subunit
MALFLIAVSLLPLGLIIGGLTTGTLRVLRSNAVYKRATQPLWFWLTAGLYVVFIGWCWYVAAKSWGVLR